jgi:hypothetical protein
VCLTASTTRVFSCISTTTAVRSRIQARKHKAQKVLVLGSSGSG